VVSEQLPAPTLAAAVLALALSAGATAVAHLRRPGR
jgi:hypothetical protein